jgi:peptidoglycan/LPS O-acetylase OafA/YrhL
MYRARDAIWARLPAIAPMLAVLAICAILLAPALGPEWLFDGISLFCFPILLMMAARGEVRHAGPFLVLGLASYPVYLLHGSVHVLIERWVDVSRWAPWSGVVFIGIIFAIALAFERWVERPLRRIARRLVEAPGRRLLEDRAS